ncbi:hypothetical protein EDB89DRAFT_2077428 [Lactarius sanguifluus]|nr:hypothetical protein EDB89DRAFT_2077428 [Lactarius sanguifluus]
MAGYTSACRHACHVPDIKHNHSSSRFQDIFNAASKSYRKQTNKDLIAHPLASQLQSCNSISAILAVLQDQVREFDKAHGGDERLTKWLIPTVNVLYAFSAVVSEGVSLVFSPAKVAKDVAASKDALAELFERIGFFFNRLESYTEVTPTAAMTNIITKIMVEVLTIFGIATKELRRGSAKKFLKKLAGRADLEDAIKKSDRLTQEEARMALAEVLKITHIVRDDVKVVDSKVEGIDDKVDDVGDKVDDIGDKTMWSKVGDIGDRVQSVDEKVKVIIDDGREAKLIIQQTANNLDELKWNQLTQLLREWLSPADPSTNHNIARKAQHKGTAAWFFQGRIFFEWKATGSLLWTHGKPGSGKSVICSSIIQDIMAVCEAGSAIMAYFYFDFRDLNKQSCCDLLLSLVSQFSTSSILCWGILNRVYISHKNGAHQPSDDTLKECLKEMLRLPEQESIFIVLDALDECPDSSGMPSHRDEVLQLVKELIDLDLQGRHICVTSRPEVDIRAVLDPLASHSVSLHNQSGQRLDIANYVRNVVNSSSSMAMRRWRPDDRGLVQMGIFQLEALRHCFPPNLRRFLNELHETLDEIYEWILKGINKTQKDDARRLLQCLAVAVRPLRVEELAELLAFDFQASRDGGIPKLKDDWLWNDQEEAVLSTCSSLIIVVPDGDSRVVQFSHFSVKEYLTSPRLAHSQGDVSRFHVDLEPAHTILAQACLGTLLRLDEHADAKGFPLVEYAARHWVDHARFEKVSTRVRDGMDDLFDSSKPHFAAWLRVHDMDNAISKGWLKFSLRGSQAGSPLYYAAFCGFYDLTERLIVKHPGQVNAGGGFMRAPLPAALSKKYFDVADLLRKHGRGCSRQIREDSTTRSVDHWKYTNARTDDRRTPLHVAALNTHLAAVQMLQTSTRSLKMAKHHYPTLYPTLMSLRRERGSTSCGSLLLEYGADPNAFDGTGNHSTPLHEASSKGFLEVARVLLSHGANVASPHRSSARSLPALSVGDDTRFAVKAVEHAQTYLNLLEKIPTRDLKLTRFDDEIFEHTLREFPEFATAPHTSLIGLDEGWMKGEEQWRAFITSALCATATVNDTANCVVISPVDLLALFELSSDSSDGEKLALVYLVKGGQLCRIHLRNKGGLTLRASEMLTPGASMTSASNPMNFPFLCPTRSRRPPTRLPATTAKAKVRALQMDQHPEPDKCPPAAANLKKEKSKSGTYKQA